MRGSRRAGWIVLLAPVALSACFYKGAVYSQYTEYDLSVAVRPEEARPVQVNLGYNRGTLALVPRMDSQAYSGEAASLISRERIGSAIDPTSAQATDATVDASFAAGNASIILSLPHDRSWFVVDSEGTPLYSGRTQGEPADRIKKAFRPTGWHSCAGDQMYDELVGQARSRNDPSVFDEAASAAGAPFKAIYDGKKAADGGVARPAPVAFALAYREFTRSEPGCGPRQTAVLAGLRKALE